MTANTPNKTEAKRGKKDAYGKSGQRKNMRGKEKGKRGEGKRDSDEEWASDE